MTRAEARQELNAIQTEAQLLWRRHNAGEIVPRDEWDALTRRGFAAQQVLRAKRRWWWSR